MVEELVLGRSTSCESLAAASLRLIVANYSHSFLNVRHSTRKFVLNISKAPSSKREAVFIITKLTHGS